MLADVLTGHGCYAEAPIDLYEDMFRLGQGYIQRSGEAPGSFKGNPLVLGKAGDAMHRLILFEDTFYETLTEAQGWDWAIISGCTYFGRSNSAERQSKLFALIFDLDGIDDTRIMRLMSGIEFGTYPAPQHIVLSGHGAHLYYVLDEPVDLYPQVKVQLKKLKYALTDLLWNRFTSEDEHVQHQGINQGFRVPGSRCKEGAPIKVCQAFRYDERPASLETLSSSYAIDKSARVDLSQRFAPSKCSADEAKRLWPGWYSRVIEQGLPSGRWKVKEDLYEWWLRRLRNGEATCGHRYFCIMCLAIFAAKCGIYDRERVRADALSLLKAFNALAPDQPFTEQDVDSALECLDGRYATFPRSDMAKLSGIEIKANTRNGRSRAQHLLWLNGTRKFKRDVLGEDAYARNGAPGKCDLVRSYAAEHPRATQREIAEAIGVSKTTVNKWLKDWQPDQGD